MLPEPNKAQFHVMNVLKAFPMVTLLINMGKFFINPWINPHVSAGESLEQGLSNLIRSLFGVTWIIVISTLLFGNIPLINEYLSKISAGSFLRNCGLFSISEGLIAALLISAALFRQKNAAKIQWLIAGQIYQASSFMIIPAILMTHFGMRIIYQYGDLSSPNIAFETKLIMLAVSLFTLFLTFRLVINPISKYLRIWHSNLWSCIITWIVLGLSYWISSLATSLASNIGIFRTY